jgi:thiamine-phosphate pyrophosphorylase
VSSLPWPCLMLVTEPSPRLPEIVTQALAGGVNMVQWREKRSAGAGYFHAYAQLTAIMPEGVPLAVNGNWEAAAQRGARAIHLPEQSVPVGVVRHRLGKKSLIGKSVHSVHAAQQAAKQGADYLVAGTIFASSSHPEIAPAGPDFLREVCAAVTVPVIAIGGVTPENISLCIAAGAVGVAVLSPIMRADDPRTVAQTYRAALNAAWETRS